MQELEAPHNAESEAIIVGAIVNDPSVLPNIKQQLGVETFFVSHCRKAYAAMIDLFEADEPISPVLVAQMAGIPVTVLMEMARGVPSMNLKPYIDRVIAASRRRWILYLVENARQAAQEGDETEDEILSTLAARIDQARAALPARRNVARLMSEMVDDQAERYRRWHQGISNALPTGFTDIDEKLLGGGLVKSGLYILAARPSMGKTSMALDIAANIARENKIVHFVSREMPSESLFDRLHSAASGVARWKLRPGIFQSDYQRLIHTLAQVGDLPIVLDNASLTVSDIRSTVRDLQRKQTKPDMVIVDYIQLLVSEGKRGSRNDEVGSTTRDLKGLAMEFDVPVLALSQLSRDCEKNHREPETFDLRDSGEIEQHADAIMFLFGDKPEEGARLFERTFKVAKQRDGELFRRQLMFNGELVTFRSLDQLVLAGVQQMGGVA